MFNLSAVAARLRDDDPLYDQLPDDEKRKIAEDLITLLGGDADDPLTVALVMAPPEVRRVATEVAGLSSLAGEVIPMGSRKPKGAPLIARFMLATRLTDGQAAGILGISRPTVNLWKNGRVPERYTEKQRRDLAAKAQEQLDAISAVLEELLNKRGGGLQLGVNKFG